ncbi:uncharacterized protein LOC133845467 isoform X1 [Drosophila sulfurigaster albostrigata]|uniref:uncharacterized protein LOC133845467 isoform X1 n=2 Tax=Drosophila sulfurigaster albostrigata TaxID=89887 RepID=UPI002D21A3BA|nr:uncharacterized protein LOC133845467 isoform X1 [Drosophila sulfurigaster albostrigata]
MKCQRIIICTNISQLSEKRLVLNSLLNCEMLMYKLLWSCMGFVMCTAHVTFTNLKCTFLNESLGEFKICRIRAVNRTHKYISMYAKPKIILDDITGNMKIMRFDYGYKPFFIDITIDVCKYLKNPQNVIVTTFYNTFKKMSNINHTCPYKHDVIIDKVWTGNLENDFSRYLPIPNGDYAIYCTFNVSNVELVKIFIYVRKS